MKNGRTWLPGMTPPQNATSVQHCVALAAPRLVARFSTVVVGGIELSGMSTTVVIPPDAAARVPVQKPSQSVRPGSLRCTCALQTERHKYTRAPSDVIENEREVGVEESEIERCHDLTTAHGSDVGDRTYSTSPGRRYLSPTSTQRSSSSPARSA